jgi:hypothetical protein
MSSTETPRQVAERAWLALKQQECSDPDKAVRVVMLTEESFIKAVMPTFEAALNAVVEAKGVSNANVYRVGKHDGFVKAIQEVLAFVRTKAEAWETYAVDNPTRAGARYGPVYDAQAKAAREIETELLDAAAISNEGTKL